jgi:hypothetical protein
MLNNQNYNAFDSGLSSFCVYQLIRLIIVRESLASFFIGKRRTTTVDARTPKALFLGD